MIDAQGIVTAVDGEYVIVRMDESGCGRCHEAGGCGGHNLGKMFCSTPHTFRGQNPGKLAIGDRVNVTIADGAIRRSVTYAYAVPLLALLVGAIGGDALAGELGAMIGAFACLFIAWRVLHRTQRRNAGNPVFQPFIRT